MSSTSNDGQRRLARICVLVSGNGSNLQAILDATAPGKPLAELARVTLVVSNRASAYGLERARNAGVPTRVHQLKPYRDRGVAEPRQQFDRDLADLVLANSGGPSQDDATATTPGAPDLVVLAGWMHILSPAFLDQFPNRVINLHPALPGEFDGVNSIGRAFDAYKAGQLTRTGVMVHCVVPEVDRGAPILLEAVPIHAEDTLETLEARMHTVEHRLLVQAIAKYLREIPLVN
ncbi:phosphoribosylglycinamide formyltransferase [Thamnocephalis sphaerospora]|uniref:phosphoribosylglycinamide formyltransferase 1 n=1 Tax=Thamnocephalis sphaerospora TaxID=78915 RepID=A0A4P9XV88_9FUNG|nr:phosphoribosylglycinamide formyltransferase [Thamnocephalis sphaerospora]|eukprot:RKP10187.1 phosphoribosylglycinamide formyltransferase [Thamnocephalis sphaerospora]